MFILLAVIAATVIGVAIQFLVRPREVRGVALSGAIAAAVAAAIYTGLTWAGLGEGSVWTWLASIGGGAVVSAAVTIVLTRVRVQRDQQERVRLGIG